jgi:hypothetical protein
MLTNTIEMDNKQPKSTIAEHGGARQEAEAGGWSLRPFWATQQVCFKKI